MKLLFHTLRLNYRCKNDAAKRRKAIEVSAGKHARQQRLPACTLLAYDEQAGLQCVVTVPVHAYWSVGINCCYPANCEGCRIIAPCRLQCCPVRLSVPAAMTLLQQHTMVIGGECCSLLQCMNVSNWCS
jgi:hypothetical protein